MAGMTRAKQTLSAYLAAGGRLSERQVLAAAQYLSGKLAKLHQAGKLYGALSADRVILDEQLRMSLAKPPDAIEQSGIAEPMLPPELHGISLPSLPADLEAARGVLRAAGSTIDPRRIDVYQLGVLLCTLVSGEEPAAYLFSPKVKARVPPAWRNLIDQMLGYDPAARIETCEELPSATAQVAAAISSTPAPNRAAAADTPHAGTLTDASNYTPPDGSPTGDRFSLEPPAGGHETLPFTELGHYRIVQRLGSGGMGDVYLGYEPALDRRVAIKVLPPELARQADFVQRFVDEAKAAARLVHPNIVQIYFIGEDRGHHFFAMQFVPGETLAARLPRTGRFAMRRSALNRRANSGRLGGRPRPWNDPSRHQTGQYPPRRRTQACACWPISALSNRWAVVPR